MKPLINNYSYIDDLPEGVVNFWIVNHDGINLVYELKDGRRGFILIDEDGYYKIVGWSDELSEEQAGNIVGNCTMERVDLDGIPLREEKVIDYFDYDRVKWYVLASAHESFRSLLRSKGITTRSLILVNND